MKALVTGITGFAGSHLARLLFKNNVEVYGVSSRPAFESPLGIDPQALRYFAADVRDGPQIERLLAEIRPDLIFHLAAKTSPTVSKEEPGETFEVNFGGTFSLLEAARRLGLPCRFLLVSSAHIYGRVPAAEGPIPEDAQMRPRTPYAASKAAAELLAYQYCQAYGLDIVRVRAFNHTGPGQSKGFVCPDLASHVAEMELGLQPPRLVVSNPNGLVDLSDVRDIVQGYYAAVLKGRPGEVYNLCSGKGIAVRAIVRELASAALRPIEVQEDLSKSGGGATMVLVGDSSRALKELGWRALIPLKQMLGEVLAYWRRSVAERAKSEGMTAGQRKS